MSNPSLMSHFASVPDPRIERTKRHKLIDIIAIALCGVICGANDWVAIEAYGRAKESWLRQFLELPNGIPAHDTFGDVFARLDSATFRQCFMDWVQAVYVATQGQVIAFDGKCVRGSKDGTLGKNAIYMVSAWATTNHLVLGQMKVDDKSNEITAIPALLALLDVAGCIVTIDAMGCQKDIAQTIVDAQGDYLLALKENHPLLYQEVNTLFQATTPLAQHAYTPDHTRTVEKDHGRLEIRECWTLSDPNGFPFLHDAAAWPKLQTLAMLRRERQFANHTTVEIAFYLSSLPGSASRLLEATRAHWGIENSLHWVLDVAFREDDQRFRPGNGPQNSTILRHMALNLLQHETTAKGGVQVKRLRAGWDDAYLLKVLALGDAEALRPLV
jgi:predicted transposase YbfD/YdcC